MRILATEAGCVEASSPEPSNWQRSLRQAVRSGRELLEMLGLPQNDANLAAETDFPVFAPREFIAKIKPGDPADPLLRQVLAHADETDARWEPGLPDPVGDLPATRMPGLIQKYSGRALLITTGVCAIHCRYCFRRNFPYQSTPKSVEGWRPAIEAIGNDPTLSEIILSGGDPLAVTDQSLRWLFDQLNACPHVNRIRLHTRFPVVIPGRVTPGLLDCIGNSRAAVFIVLHINHPNELDTELTCQLRKLSERGATLLNQAVLLRGVNDDRQIQLALCERLVNARVLPYYLHQLDRAKGATHFEVPVEVGLGIMEYLRQKLPGYAVPRYVREIAGQPGKTPILPSHVEPLLDRAILPKP